VAVSCTYREHLCGQVVRVCEMSGQWVGTVLAGWALFQALFS